jgi:hypothetical protein
LSVESSCNQRDKPDRAEQCGAFAMHVRVVRS